MGQYDSLPVMQGLSQADAAALKSIMIESRALTYPTLSDDDLLFILKKAKRQDYQGRSISDPNWLPTYNLNYGVIQGWRLKAGNATANYDFGDSDQKLSRSQVNAMCMDMVKEYQKREVGSVTIFAPQRNAVNIPSGIGGIVFLPTEAEQGNN